jgi:hypothetical protein
VNDDSQMKQCDFCSKWIDEAISVDLSDTSEAFDFCDWPCVAAFALKRLKEMSDSANARITDLNAKLEELDHQLAQVRGQAGI